MPRRPICGSEMCGKHRKRPAAEDADDDNVGVRRQLVGRSEFADRVHAFEPGAVEHQELAARRAARTRQSDRRLHRRRQEVGGDADRRSSRETGQKEPQRRQAEARLGGRHGHRDAATPASHHPDDFRGAARRIRAADRPLRPAVATRHACCRGQQFVHELHGSGQRRTRAAHGDARCAATRRRRADAPAAPEGKDRSELLAEQISRKPAHFSTC